MSKIECSLATSIMNLINYNQSMRYFIFFFLFVFAVEADAQATQKQQAASLNNYVYFTNESVHGLLIVHRLLENFNQKINKYVDLESTQFNFYSNADLPRNIFLDEEKWFYDVSPYAWYDITLTESKHLPVDLATDLNKELEQLKSIITRVNAIRFELGHLTEGDDLKKRKNLDKIYAKLEECVVLYDNFNTVKEELHLKLKDGHKQLNITDDAGGVQVIGAIHENIKAILQSLRNDKEANLPNLAKHLESNLNLAKNTLNNTATAKQFFTKADAFLASTNKCATSGSFSEDYIQYGKTYYYYNVELVSKINRYGSGLVTDMNDYIKSANESAILQTEEPHFFKVIYPKKQVKVVTAETLPGGQLPSTVRGRQVVVRQAPMKLNEPTMLLEISDYQLSDGDKVSINFNEHWILNEYVLKRKPLKIQLRLRPNQVNYLLVHAENVGTNPPNTTKITYIYNGEKKVITLSSDTQESEMIEIKLDK